MTATRPITLITGASAGIGVALAQVFAAHDHALVLVARRQAQLDAVAETIAATGKPRPQVIALDLGAPGAADRLAEELARRGLEPAVVVNNAGFGLVGTADALALDEQLAMVDLNVRVLTDLSLRFTDALARHRGGVLNVASVSGFLPGPGMAVYHATKAYVVSFSEALHAELEPKGVRVTALCPGPVLTEFQARARMPGDYFPLAMVCSPERVAQEGYAAFMAGRWMIAPGYRNNGIALFASLLPRRLLLWIQYRRYEARRAAEAASS
jgi:short-subunit dehydrogenase